MVDKKLLDNAQSIFLKKLDNLEIWNDEIDDKCPELCKIVKETISEILT